MLVQHNLMMNLLLRRNYKPKVEGVTPTSQEFRVNAEVEGKQVNPVLTTLSNNHFVVHWTHSEPFKEFYKFIFNKCIIIQSLNMTKLLM